MMTERCDGCNKFAVIVDSYTPFGGPTDIEPPDEVRLCQKCVDEDMANWRKMGWMPSHWRMAAYEYVLAKEMGFELKVEGMNGWGVWIKVDKKKKKENDDHIYMPL